MPDTIAVSIIIIMSVMLFGSVADWSFAVVGMTTILFFNVWLFRTIKDNNELLTVDKQLKIFIVIFFIYCVLQIIPLPGFMLKIFSSEKYFLIKTLSLPGFHSVSFNPYATMHALVKFIVYMMIFFMTFSLAAEKKNLINLAKIIVFFGLCLAVFALIQKAAWNGRIYWFKEFTQNATPFGPFVNKNHYAGLIGMIIPFGLSLSFRSRSNAKRFLYIFSTVIMSLSLFYTLSRGGIVSFIISIIFFSLMVMLRRNTPKRFVVLGVFIALLMAYVLYFGITPVIEKFAATEMTLSYRVTAWRGFLEASRDFWFAGAGLGTFKYLSPMYHPEGLRLYFDHAHNDYLEFFIEMGCIGSVIIGGFLVVYFKSILFSKWLQGRNFYLILGGLSAIVFMALHSLVDFNLHIPSNAIMLLAILGLVYGMIRKTIKE